MFRKIITYSVVFAMFQGLCYAGEQLPVQNIENTKGFASINYDRQDSDQTGIQRIINDHSAFNINILIVKKGALFKGKNNVEDTNEENKGVE